jgi:hypothetical protein
MASKEFTQVAVFEVAGPFEITREQKKGGTQLDFADFWRDESPACDYAERCGCYVSAVQNGGGCTPVYVGKATKSFKQEAFNPANRHKYHVGLLAYEKGTPVMFFVVHPIQKGKTNDRQIASIEDHLIQRGVEKNPNLLNVKGAKLATWSINGVVRSGPGKKSTAAKKFCSVFGF